MRKLSRYCLWSSLSWIISQKSRIYLIESSHSHNWSNNNYVFWAAFSRIRLKIFKIETLFKKIMFVWDTREIFHKKNIYIYPEKILNLCDNFSQEGKLGRTWNFFYQFPHLAAIHLQRNQLLQTFGLIDPAIFVNTKKKNVVGWDIYTNKSRSLGWVDLILLKMNSKEPLHKPWKFKVDWMYQTEDIMFWNLLILQNIGFAQNKTKHRYFEK